MSAAENNQLIETTVARIVATKTDDEPFDTAAKFWTSGFHRKAFDYLGVIISTVFLDSFDKIWFGDRTEDFGKYPEPLAEELNRIPVRDNVRINVENITKEFIHSTQWVTYPSLRKEVLRRLHRTSFSLLGPKKHDLDTVCEQYVTPAWAKWKNPVKQ